MAVATPKEAQDILVYLVDDDRGMVGATSQWLSLSGLKIRAFADPLALLKIIKPNQPCVIVSDIRMPGIDGIELMKQVHAKDPIIPVILITGHGDIPLAVESMRLGAHEFLAKPFSPEKLLEVVLTAQRNYQAAIEEKTQSALGSKMDSEPQTIKTRTAPDLEQSSSLTDQVEAYEKTLIETALAESNGSMVKVMEQLDIPRRTLNAKMKKYGIERTRFRG
jgi:two-component system C4-dicarboxylate transport response regulator DctD